MVRYDHTSDYFLELSNKCRFNETIASWYEQLADLEYDALTSMLEQTDHRSIYRMDEFRSMTRYSDHAKGLRLCMRTGWTSDYYRMQGVKVVQSVNRCRDRFCYNCQSLDALQRFHKYAPVIDAFTSRYDLYHCVFTLPNVPGFLLKGTLDLMGMSFSRLVGFLSGKKKIRGLDLVGEYGFAGAVRALEVSRNDEDLNYHPHYHCMFAMRKGMDVTPRYRNTFTKDYTHRREDRLFSDFEVFLQRIWYLLLNGIRVTKKNLEDLPQIGKKSYPDGFSCYAEPAEGRYHEIFKYVTKGSYSNHSILDDFECFRTLHGALRGRRVYQTYGCFYGLDLESLHEGQFDPSDMADMCFNEIVGMLDEREKPLCVIETLSEILKQKVRDEDAGVRYISAQSVRRLYDETPPEERAELKGKIIAAIWTSI